MAVASRCFGRTGPPRRGPVVVLGGFYACGMAPGIAETSETDAGLAPEKPKRLQFGLVMGSPEWRAEMELRRAAKVASGDERAKGGRDRKPTREQAKEQALEKLVPQAIKVLEAQLTDEDPKIRQAAAVKILEWGKGKPRQTVETVGEQVTVIRYETAAAGPAAN